MCIKGWWYGQQLQQSSYGRSGQGSESRQTDSSGCRGLKVYTVHVQKLMLLYFVIRDDCKDHVAH